MSFALGVGAAGAAGLALGVAFFGGLWLTVSGLGSSARPVLRVTLSMVLRFGLAVAVFFALARFGDWQHVVAGAVGFLVPRVALGRRLGPGNRGGADA